LTLGKPDKRQREADDGAVVTCSGKSKTFGAHDLELPCRLQRLLPRQLRRQPVQQHVEAARCCRICGSQGDAGPSRETAGHLYLSRSGKCGDAFEKNVGKPR
jgi:hypothetical protein